MAKPAPRTRSQASADRLPPADDIEARFSAKRRLIISCVVTVIMVGAIAWGIGAARWAVARRAMGERPHVVLMNRPAWMTDLVAQQLTESFRPQEAQSPFDREGLVEVHSRLKANPWVESVQSVRRVFGSAPGDTIEVDCQFRKPLALVREPETDFYWFVDAKGVLLPERFDRAELSKVVYAQDMIAIRVVEGVRNPPPAQAGRLWPGDDLLAGLDMAVRLAGLHVAADITRIDVSNYSGRVDPRNAHVVLVTRYDTQVRWGRPWIATDAFIEVKPERKIEIMQALVKKFGRVDANAQWVDLRFDDGYRSPDQRAGYMTPEKRTIEASTRSAGEGR